MEHKLKQKLLTNYDNDVFPTRFRNHSLTVHFGMAVINVLDVVSGKKNFAFSNRSAEIMNVLCHYVFRISAIIQPIKMKLHTMTNRDRRNLHYNLYNDDIIIDDVTIGFVIIKILHSASLTTSFWIESGVLS